MKNKKINFIKANPSGNTTIFVLDSVPREDYPAISAALMKHTSLCAEQVGFLEKPADARAAARMHMMGGEFCGNASRSFAAWLTMGGLDYIASGENTIIPFSGDKKRMTIKVSGHEGLLLAELENIGSQNGCFAETAMPLPQFVRHGEDTRLGKYSIVGFEGIIHVILWQRSADKTYFEQVRALLISEGLSDECFGIMFIGNEDPSSMTPLVYVGAVNSLTWESSCGSGSLSVAAALADNAKESVQCLKISQPGGDLLVSVLWDNGFSGAYLAGNVYFTAIGSAWVEF